MVEQLAEKCFVPFVERLFRSLAEQVNAVGGVGSTRRSGKSLLGGMKRIFGGSNSSSKAVEAVPGGSYLNDSPELIQRRYADLALLLQQYELAYQVNHKLKNEFLSEHAWEHYAAAMELAGTASFLQEHRVYPTTLMEQAISRYLDNCKCACASASASASPSARAHLRIISLRLAFLQYFSFPNSMTNRSAARCGRAIRTTEYSLNRIMSRVRSPLRGCNAT